MFTPFTLLRNAVCVVIGAASLAACNSGANGSPFLTAPSAASRGRHTVVPNTTQRILMPDSDCCDIAVDRRLNQIYVSSGVRLSGNHTTVVDGNTFSISGEIAGFGGAYNVDAKTDNVWLPGLYSGEVKVVSGQKHSSIATVSLGYCPVASWVDARHRYAWIAAQCGSGSDPVWAIDADTAKVVAGPIHTGGVMGDTTVNPVTGRFYVNNSSGSYEINPSKGFALAPTSFGVAFNVDDVSNLIYAQITNGLNIVDGYSQEIRKTVTLSYTPAFVGVNAPLNHIYTGSSGQSFIEVREGDTGKLLGKVTLSGVNIYWVAGDYTGVVGYIYAFGTVGNSYYLYRVTDAY